MTIDMLCFKQSTGHAIARSSTQAFTRSAHTNYMINFQAGTNLISD